MLSDMCPGSTGMVACLQPDCTVHVIDVSALQLDQTDSSDIQQDVGAAICAGFEHVSRAIIGRIGDAYESIGVATRAKDDAVLDTAAQTIIGQYVLAAIFEGETLCSPWGFLEQQVDQTVHSILADDWDEDTTENEE